MCRLPRPWLRHTLTVLAFGLGLAHLVVSIGSLQHVGWSNERTILYAAEGGVMAPREALMHVVLFLVGSLTWFFVFGATVAPAGSRARWVFRGAVGGIAAEMAVAAMAALVCGSFSEWLALAVALALPMAIVAVLVRRRRA